MIDIFFNMLVNVCYCSERQKEKVVIFVVSRIHQHHGLVYLFVLRHQLPSVSYLTHCNSCFAYFTGNVERKVVLYCQLDHVCDSSVRTA